MVKEKFMFVIISKKKYNAIISELNSLKKAFKQHAEQEKVNFSKVNKKIAEVEEKAGKRYVSDNFSNENKKPKKTWNELMNEYLNGEDDKDNKGGN